MGEIQIKYVFLFGLLLILRVSAASSSASNRNNFDIYQLVVQWAPATCTGPFLTQPCSQLPRDEFSIRGLWPTRLSPFQILERCSGSVLVPDNILPIEFGLYQNWPDVISANDQHLWMEEWRKHGTCSEHYLNQLEYFATAVNFFNRHNLFRILTDNSIRPQRDIVVDNLRDRIEETITRALGVRPLLRCNYNERSYTVQVHEISLCFSRDSKTLTNCTTLSTCTSTLGWYPYMRTLYSHFQVAFQWQPATCFNNENNLPRCLRNPEIRFSINGVWPVTSTGMRPLVCPGSNFDINKISLMRNRLDKGWPDLFNVRNDGLWGREWRNHGVCSEDQFGQEAYFGYGLHVFETYDILGILRRNNIVPNGERYLESSVKNAIIRVTGVVPFTLCIRKLFNNTVHYTQLHQIVFCYDDYGRQLQNCINSQLLPGLRLCPSAFNWFP